MNMPRAVRWIAIAVGVVLVVLAIVAGAGSRTATLRQLVIETLADRLDSDVELQWFSVDTFPTVDVRGEGLVIRLKGRTDVPPLLQIRSFAIKGGMLGLISRPRRFRSVTLEGLEINIPPGGANLRADPGTAASPESGSGASPILIERLVASDAVLRLIPRQAGKTPREFAIHRLAMSGVGIEQRMPFEAELTNPVPRGLIKTSGRFGPWDRSNPGATPLDGKYDFDKADLGTIKGLAGVLTSTGEFGGRLERIQVKGETRTPDFQLTLTNKPLPLTTQFEAVVDGTDGDTYLKAVNARLDQTGIFASGAVVGTPGVKGRTVQLHVKVDDGRIEDFLDLAVKSDRPVMRGRIALHSDFVLPPGPRDVAEKLRLTGEFDLSAARFTDPGVRGKLASMSQRARGEHGEPAADVMSGIEGRFRLDNGTMSLMPVRFQIPGAGVELTGTYGLQSEALEFDGTLRMQATISEAAGGGLKSVLLKMVDPLFRKRGAGTELPIRVRGTRSEPKFGVDVVRALTPK
jgi:hypothetical protein